MDAEYPPSLKELWWEAVSDRSDPSDLSDPSDRFDPDPDSDTDPDKAVIRGRYNP